MGRSSKRSGVIGIDAAAAVVVVDSAADVVVIVVCVVAAMIRMSSGRLEDSALCSMFLLVKVEVLDLVTSSFVILEAVASQLVLLLLLLLLSLILLLLVFVVAVVFGKSGTTAAATIADVTLACSLAALASAVAFVTATALIRLVQDENCFVDVKSVFGDNDDDDDVVMSLF